MEQQDSKRIRLVEIPAGVLDLEYNSKYAILHLPKVTRFKKSDLKLFKDYLEGLASFFEVSKLEGPYAATGDEKAARLAEKLGFLYLTEQDGLKVYIYAPSSNGSRSGCVGGGSRPSSKSR